MWPALIQIQKVLQKIRPLRMIYSEEKDCFIKNPLFKSKYKVYLSDFSLVLAVYACMSGLNRVLKSEFQIDPAKEYTPEQIKIQTQKAILSSVLFFLFGTLYGAGVAAGWTFANKLENTLWLLNTGRGLFLKRLKNPGKILGVPTKRESSIFGILLYIMVLTTIFGYLAGCVICVVSDSNPGRVILTWILPETAFQERPTLIKAVSMVFVFTSGFFGVIPIMQVYVYFAATIFEMTFILRRGYNYTHSFKVKWKLNTFQREWQIYAENILFIKEANQLGMCLYPDLLMSAFTIIVATTTVCMKFHDELPIPMLCVFLGFDGVVSVAACILLSFTVVGKEESENFLLYWKPRIFSKLGRRQLRACIPTSLSIGPFFEIQRSTLLNTENEIVNMVVTLLLMDE